MTLGELEIANELLVVNLFFLISFAVAGLNVDVYNRIVDTDVFHKISWVTHLEGILVGLVHHIAPVGNYVGLVLEAVCRETTLDL